MGSGQGKVKEAWGSLTDDDLDRSKGQWDQLVGTIKERTGETQADIEKRLNQMLRTTTAPSDRRSFRAPSSVSTTVNSVPMAVVSNRRAPSPDQQRAPSRSPPARPAGGEECAEPGRIHERHFGHVHDHLADPRSIMASSAVRSAGAVARSTSPLTVRTALPDCSALDLDLGWVTKNGAYTTRRPAPSARDLYREQRGVVSQFRSYVRLGSIEQAPAGTDSARRLHDGERSTSRSRPQALPSRGAASTIPSVYNRIAPRLEFDHHFCG